MIVRPHSSRERETKREASRFFFDSNLLLPFGFFLSFFSRRCGKEKRKKKEKNRWFENRDDDVFTTFFLNDRSASLPEEHFFRKKVESTGPFFGLFWSFRKGLFDFSKKRAPLEKDIAHARRER